MSGKKAYLLCVVVLLCVALAGTFVWATARQAGETAFTSNGDLISGWYWLRSAGHTATWTFSTAPLNGASNVYINFNPLVTNGVNGGSGYDATCKVVVEGAKTWTTSIHVVNPFRPIDPAHSSGVGYQCYGHSGAPIPTGVYKGVSTIKITVAYPFPSGRHVAVNRGCMTLGYSR